MTDDVSEVRFRKHQRDERTPPPGYENLGGEFVTPAYKAFLQAAMDGKLPEPENVPELPQDVRDLAQELAVIHLPEWRNPAGRKLAEPTSMRIGGAVRLAEYLIARGVTFDPDQATVRWIPTPGVSIGAGDPGKHIYRNPDGTWPQDPDIEEFWSVEDITTEQLEDGQWAAVHPRGVQCQAATKTEAYALCVQRLAAKVAEAKEGSR